MFCQVFESLNRLFRIAQSGCPHGALSKSAAQGFGDQASTSNDDLYLRTEQPARKYRFHTRSQERADWERQSLPRRAVAYSLQKPDAEKPFPIFTDPHGYIDTSRQERCSTLTTPEFPPVEWIEKKLLYRYPFDFDIPSLIDAKIGKVFHDGDAA